MRGLWLAYLVAILGQGCTAESAPGHHTASDASITGDLSGAMEDATAASGANKIAPPPQGVYLGIAERDTGDMTTFEQALGRRAPLFWPYPVLLESREGVIDADLSFDAAEAQRAWDHGYLVMVGLEPHPENGMRVDDLLRGKYDEHLRRLAGQFRQFGKPMFFATAREPNLVLLQWKGGYGPDGDKSLFWALETEGATATAAFDPSRFPDSQRYQGLGDPTVDDGLERLAAAQRYYHDFFVNQQGLEFLTFETMGWAIGFEQWDDGEIPTELQVDFATFHELLGDTADWVSLNFYTLFATDPTRAVEQNLAVLDAQVKAIRQAGIDKPILITELGLCGTDITRGAIVSGVMERLVIDYPEVAGFQLWNIGFAHESFADKPCILDATIGFPEIKQAMARHPDHFHACPRFGDGRPMPTCADTPSDVLPRVGCLDRCLQQGQSEAHCLSRCEGS
jgi:hypothetical protein